MAAWLYQMAEDEEWKPEDYRHSVWEGEMVTWLHRKIVRRGSTGPDAGDRIIFFFAKSGTSAPGICGWGVILQMHLKRGELTFRVVYPSDFLKMKPIWDTSVKKLVNDIRGGHPRATMWLARPRAYDALAAKIQDYLRG
jgi:hypothetical protein